MHAQLPFIQRSLTESDGLLSNYVQSILLDSRNKLWIGTDKGLSQYDGNRFIHYTAADGLTNTYVNSLQDYRKADAILAFTAGGNLYAVRQNTLTAVQPSNITFSNPFVTDSLIYYSERKQDTFKLYEIDPATFRAQLVLSATPNFDAYCAVIKSGTLTLNNAAAKDSIYYTNLSMEVTANASENPGAMQYYYQPGNGWYYSSTNSKTELIFKDPGRSWLHHTAIKWNGRDALLLNLYNSGDLLLLQHGRPSLSLPASQTKFRVITTLLPTPEGNALLGTMGQGLVWVGTSKASLFLPGQQVQRIALDNGTVYATGDSALYMVKANGEAVKQLSVKLSHATHLQVDDETLHLTTLLNYRRFQKNASGQVKLLHTETLNKGISGYATLPNSNYLLSTYSTGTSVISSNHNLIKEVGADDGPYPNIVEKIIPFKDGIVITSYDEGMTVVPNSGKVYRFTKENGLPNNTVYHAACYGETWHIGLEKAFQIRTPKFSQTFLPHNGLEGRRILYSFVDAKSRVFVVSENRLMLVRHNRLLVLNSMPVIPSKEHTVIVALFDSTTQALWCGTTGGLLRLNISSFELNMQPVEPFLQATTGWMAAAVTGGDNGRIGANGLGFTIAHNHFNEIESVPVYYRLQGWSHQWQLLPSNGQLQFQHLPPGNYRLEVKTFSNDGISSPVRLLKSFNVLPPFYLRWYAILIYAILLLLLGMRLAKWYGNYRMQKQLRQYMLERKIQEERNRISGDLHDNVGSQLTTIIAQLDYVEGQLQQKRPAEALKKIEQIQQKSRQVMTQLRESIWALHEDAVSIGTFMMKVRQYALTVFDMDMGIDCQVEIPLEQGPELSPWQAVNLLRVVQEACQNIQKHANASAVKITSVVSLNQLHLSIADNGKGFDTNKARHGHGLSNMQKRLVSMGGQFQIQSSPDGVVIKTAIPLLQTGQMPLNSH